MLTAVTEVSSLPHQESHPQTIQNSRWETSFSPKLKNTRKKKKKNLFYVNLIPLIRHKLPWEGGIAGVSTLHLPGIPHSSSQTGEVENSFIQPNEPRCTNENKWFL